MFYYFKKNHIKISLDNRFFRKSGMECTLKMKYQVSYCIFQINLAMATKEYPEYVAHFLLEFFII